MTTLTNRLYANTNNLQLMIDLLIALRPPEQLAAYCMGSINQDENARTGRSEGYTGPVATHPTFQRRGLAQALLLSGMEKLKEQLVLIFSVVVILASFGRR